MLGFTTFQKRLTIKHQSKKQKSYLYIQIQTPFFTKQYFVGKITSSHDMLSLYHQQTMIKVLTDMLKFIRKNEYSSKFIPKQELLFLDLIRITFFYQTQFLSSPETINQQKSTFQAYVHGSTSIEGNTFSLRETELTLYQSITPSGKTTREFYEVDNYRRLQTDAILINEIINKESILRLHELLMRNILSENIGEYRRISVGILGSDTTPSPPTVIDQEINDLIQSYAKDINSNDMHPLEIMVKFHSRFEQIHPFIDGNGRVGRELLRWQAKKSYFPSIILAHKTRQEYLTALKSADNDDFRPLKTLFLKLIVDELTIVTQNLSEVISQVQIRYPKRLTSRLKSELILLYECILPEEKTQSKQSHITQDKLKEMRKIAIRNIMLFLETISNSIKS